MVRNVRTTPLPLLKVEATEGDLYSALENSMQCVIEGYRTESGHTVNVESRIEIKKAPQLLKVYVNRIAYDQNGSKKINSSFKFDREIYLDRFMVADDNSNTQLRCSELHSQEARDTLNSLNLQISKVEKLLKSY